MRSRAGAIVVTALAMVAAGCGGDGPDRQAAVAARGAEVMPFDLDRTTHVFTPTASGGVQTVVADDPRDDEQIALARGHLAEEARRFDAGDFDDPAAIHGEGMPGLATLRAGHAAVDVDYADVAAGGRITYRTDDADIVEALHEWFAAQLSDHGAHAAHGDG